jgi:PhnB protein
MTMRYNHSPEPAPPGMLQAGFENKIMHTQFVVDGVRIMASDGCDDKGKREGFKLALSVATEAEAHKKFDAVAQGGQIEMPLTKTFWSPCFGMLTDPFGIAWMVMVPGAEHR